jgi:hypothetical protein
MAFCAECWKRHRNIVGLPKLANADYARHPWWAAAQKHGFTTFLDSYDLQRYH